MGCASSKLDDLPAVALCRDRCNFLDQAVRRRFAFAEAHVAYLNSLKAVGGSLDRFFSQDPDGSVHGAQSPVLNLPAHRKGDPDPAEPSESPHHHLSDSGSYLHFHSDDDDSEDEDGSISELHHHDVDSPIHQQQHPYGGGGGYFPGYENFNLNHGGGGGGYMNFNYMIKQTTPSVVYTQPPMSSNTMYMGESSSASHNHYPNYGGYNNGNMNPPYLNYNNYNDNSSYGGYFGASSPPPQYLPPPVMASSSKEPPPPPPPPSSSAWEFLNPFESFEKYYPAYTPSRDSREIREEEGIPDLENEDDEVVKAVYGDHKFTDSERSSYSKPRESKEDVRMSINDAELQYRAARPSVGVEGDPVQYEVHMVDKNVVDSEEGSKDRGNGGEFKPHRGFKGDREVVREIQVQFERASEFGNELATFLEVGKVQYKRKHAGFHVASKILHLPMVSSQPSTSKSSNNGDPVFLDTDQGVELRSKNLSSTLHKLYLWEKKLYEEVKIEEKMRVHHEQKSRKLKHLVESGAEAQKVDVTRTLVRSLSTKIKIAIQVVDKISVKINCLRDDVMWPQLNEFIQGLTRMWKSMLECHHNQCQAIGEAKRLDAIAFRKHFSDSHFEATRQLEHDLINWTLRFSYWVGAQKGYVRALNNWLMKCLLYEPEETPDGTVPFSPGRIGAPPVFIICNQWSQSMDKISEKEVVDSMREFTSNVLQLWERDKAELRRRMLANKDERNIRSLDKENQKIQKEIQALDKRMVLISVDDNMALAGHAVYQSETKKGGSLQASLQHVFEAMEKFAGNSLKVYEELLQRIEENLLGNERVM